MATETPLYYISRKLYFLICPAIVFFLLYTECPLPAQTTDVELPSDAGVYNVMDFGASGTGTIDDTAAFQAAISATFNGAVVAGGRYWMYAAGSNALLMNGAATGQTAVGMFNNGGIFVGVNSSGSWYSWNGSSLVPYTPTTIGGGTALYQGSTGTIPIGSNTWSLASTGTAMLNGSPSGKTAVGLFNNNGTLDLLDTAGNWYLWNSSASSFEQFYPNYIGTAATNFFNRTGVSVQYGANIELYIPNGTYLVSNTLENTDGTNWKAGMYLQGQSQSQTIIKLHNSCTGFTSASAPKAVIKTGSEPTSGVGAGDGNEAFRHYIRNLTIDVGSGNAGAIGIDYLVNNRGGIFNVTVKSSDPNYAGYAGISMTRQFPGPGLIKDVTVIGFNRAFSMLSQFEYSMTFENITISNQQVYGFDIDQMAANINYLTSNNSVPVINTGNASAVAPHIVLLNSVFNGGASGNTAIQGAGAIYCRNVMSTGYGTVVGSYSGGPSQVLVPEYESIPTYKEFASDISSAIALPIKPAPDVLSTNMGVWANGTTGTVTDGDYTNSIQNAIDHSGEPIVYLPAGQYVISNTIHLRNGVQKLIGCCAELIPSSTFPTNAPLIENDSPAGTTVVVQNITPVVTNGAWAPFEQNSAGTLVLRNDDSSGYCNTSSGTGDVFLEDFMSVTQPVEINYPQNVWARQLDIELQAAPNPISGTATTYLTNTGGNLWILGYKTEEHTFNGTLLQQNGGWTELLGGYFADLDGGGTESHSMIVNNGGSLSASYGMDPSPYPGAPYTYNIVDTEGGVTQNFSDGGEVPLYSGAPTPYSSVPTVVNGSFETPSLSETFQPNPSYPTTAYWNFSPSGSALEANGSPYGAPAAPDGVQAALLQTVDGSLGSVSQLIYLPTGTYELNFMAAQRSYGYQQTVTVYLGSAATGTTSVGAYPLTSTSFTPFQTTPYTVSTPGVYSLAFVANGAGADCTAFIDSVAFASASPITGLVNTGEGLADGANDPNWTITSSPQGTGQAVVVTEAPDLFTHWFADTQYSKWINFNANADGGNPPGNYTYQTTFSENSSTPIYVNVAGDDSITGVYLNGSPVSYPGGTGYTGFVNFVIPAAMSHVGTNTLEFISTNGGTANNPAGFRAEFSTSPIVGLNNTGVGLADGATDPNWTIIGSPEGTGPAYVVTEAADLFSHWFADSPTSKWINFDADADGGNPSGTYQYQTTFNEFNNTSISVNVAGDDSITNVVVNGTALSPSLLPAGTGYTGFVNFSIPASVSHVGINTLEIDSTNGGTANNPAGFRAEFSEP